MDSYKISEIPVFSAPSAPRSAAVPAWGEETADMGRDFAEKPQMLAFGPGVPARLGAWFIKFT